MSDPAILVVGGGVFGITAALELARRGRSVTLVERGSVPHPEASSTDISKAVRMDYGDDEFYAELAANAIEGWHAWNRETADDPLYHECGILLLSAAPFERGGFEADSYRTLRGRGVPVEPLEAQDIARRFPAWADAGYAWGYFNPRAGYAESGRTVGSLAARAIEAGVVVHENVRVARLAESGRRVSGVVLEDGAILRAGQALVACGAWTPFLVPGLSSWMWPIAQPVCHFRPHDPTPFLPEHFPVWCADIAQSGRYGFPVGREGLVKVGHHGPGRRFAPGDPLIVTDDERDEAVRFVSSALPALSGAPLVSTRLCLYCDTMDGDFLIDRDPEREGLVVAAGGSGHAFKFAPLLGPLVADVVEGRPHAASARFAWRRPHARRTEQARQRAPRA